MIGLLIVAMGILATILGNDVHDMSMFYTGAILCGGGLVILVKGR